MMSRTADGHDHHTIREIKGQPDLWLETARGLKANRELRRFLLPLFEKDDLQIVLTGAGSSAYIGEAVEMLFRNRTKADVTAIPTTTLITHFADSLNSSKPLLLISFARSGNSPESIGAVDLAEKRCTECYHLAVTCNPAGELAVRLGGTANSLVVVLPPASEDKGLAMTGSFTSMMLCAIYISRLGHPELTGEEDGKAAEAAAGITGDIRKAAEASRNLIGTLLSSLPAVAARRFDRIVFLGSGPRLGIARESQLKVQELTDGTVTGTFDSFLGFRHGPKAVVNNRTVVLFLFSPDSKVFRYEKDLASEIIREGNALTCVGLFPDREQNEELPLDLNFTVHQDRRSGPFDYDLLTAVIPAQILGYLKSLQLGLNPDQPSRNNTISRVVKGVTIYPEP